MDRLLARLERRFGRFAIPNLILYTVGGMALVWAASLTRPLALDRLELDFSAVRRGEVWRLVTFLFVPPMQPTRTLPKMGTGSYLGPLLAMYFTLWVGRSLEQAWGAFRFNVYFFLGMLGAYAATVVVGGASNVGIVGIDTSLLLALATVAPDESVLLFFVLPIRLKWLGIVVAGFAIFAGLRGDVITRAGIVCTLLNYLLFFGGHWWQKWRGRGTAVRQKALREQFRSTPPPAFGQRACALCGAREADGADIRVCSCEKCGGQARTLCLAHARSH